MKVVGFIPTSDAVDRVLGWTFISAGEGADVDLLCCELDSDRSTTEATRRALGDRAATVTTLVDPDPVSAVASHCRTVQAERLITCAFDLPGRGGLQTSATLLGASPCRTIVALYGATSAEEVERALVVLDGTAEDRALVQAGRQLHEALGARITLALIEEDIGRGAESLGEIALQALVHEEGLEDGEIYDTKVVVDNHPVRGLLRLIEGHDLALISHTRSKLAMPLENAVGGATVAVVKREPPLERRKVLDWIPRINPNDYAELVVDLRRGSRWQTDFVVMLAAAAAIATLGLLQNSPAVVIGSMLLAPLMTPMIGFGLALVQANQRLWMLCAHSILRGFLLTLGVSFLITLITPGGETLSPEVLARGQPNILDLLIALFAAVAAAYAMSRPGIAAAVAGVAIATALVPPACSVGISLAYGTWANAAGAAALFATNLVAIILGAALTFFLMGVSSDRALGLYRRTARRALLVLAAVLLLLAIPLGQTLGARIAEGRAQPIGYPLTRVLVRALQDRVEKDEGAELMFAGRSSKTNRVMLYVAADEAVDRALGEDLKGIVREKMGRPDIPVHVIAVRRAWRD